MLTIEESLLIHLSREARPLLVEPLPTDKRAVELYQVSEQKETADLSRIRVAQIDSVPSNLENWHLLVPMRVRGRLVGILALSRREDDQEYSDTDRRWLRFLAGRLSLALNYCSSIPICMVPMSVARNWIA